ncbi:hypothetical protein N9B39_01890 [bacterium]|nr:hypothetical protein [bacterium]
MQITGQMIFDNLDQDKLLARNEDYDSTISKRPTQKPLIKNQWVLDQLPTGPRRAMGSQKHVFDSARDLMASNVTDDCWDRGHEQRCKQQLKMLADALVALEIAKNDFTEAMLNDDTDAQNRLSDLDAKASKKVDRLLGVLAGDLVARREIPADAGRLEREGGRWINDVIDLYLTSTFEECFMHVITNRLVSISKPCDKHVINQLQLPYLIRETVEYVESA